MFKQWVCEVVASVRDMLWAYAPMARLRRNFIRHTILILTACIMAGLVGQMDPQFLIMGSVTILSWLAGGLWMFGRVHRTLCEEETIRRNVDQVTEPLRPTILVEMKPASRLRRLSMSLGGFVGFALVLYIMYAVVPFLLMPGISAEFNAIVWAGAQLAGLNLLMWLAIMRWVSDGYELCRPHIRRIEVRFGSDALRFHRLEAHEALIRDVARRHGVFGDGLLS